MLLEMNTKKIMGMNLQANNEEGYSMADRRVNGEGMQFPPDVLD